MSHTTKLAKKPKKYQQLKSIMLFLFGILKAKKTNELSRDREGTGKRGVGGGRGVRGGWGGRGGAAKEFF
jgi:hypothetical protein